MDFQIVGQITNVETIAKGKSIRDLNHLRKKYPNGKNWKKCKGIAIVKVNEVLKLAEIHWYEAHGIGRKEFKIKHYMN